MRQLQNKYTTFLKQRDGVIAIEFALVLPLLVLVIFGSIGVFENLQIKKRGIVATDALADLATRSLELNDTERDILFQSASLMFGNFEDDVELDISLTGIAYDAAEDNFRVVWSEVQNGGIALAIDSTLPAEDFPQVRDLEMLVIADISFSYNSSFYFLSQMDLNFTQTAIRKPRFVTNIAYLD